MQQARIEFKSKYVYMIMYGPLWKYCLCLFVYLRERPLWRSSLDPSNLRFATVFKLGAFPESECENFIHLKQLSQEDGYSVQKGEVELFAI